jgi:hypothetical protein
MKRNIYILAVLLCLQVLLVFVPGMGSRQEAVTGKSERLVVFRPEEVGKIEISGPEKGRVVIVKKANEWFLPDHSDFPADGKMVREFLEKLDSLDAGWPVATTSGAAERFKVSPDNFERHIILYKGDETVAELFLGTSPGVRKIHARTGGSDNIYEVKFTLFQAADDPDQWIDKNVLRIEEPAITGIRLPGITLERVGSGFAPDDLGANETVVDTEVRGLVKKVARLTIDGVLGTTQPEGFSSDSPDLEYVVVTEPGGVEHRFVFKKPEEGAYYILKTSDRPEYFKVAEWQVNGISGVKRGQLVKRADRPQTGKGDETGSGLSE